MDHFLENQSEPASQCVQSLHVELLCNVHRRFWVAASYTAFWYHNCWQTLLTSGKISQLIFSIWKSPAPHFMLLRNIIRKTKWQKRRKKLIISRSDNYLHCFISVSIIWHKGPTSRRTSNNYLTMNLEMLMTSAGSQREIIKICKDSVPCPQSLDLPCWTVPPSPPSSLLPLWQFSAGISWYSHLSLNRMSGDCGCWVRNVINMIYCSMNGNV